MVCRVRDGNLWQSTFDTLCVSHDTTCCNSAYKGVGVRYNLEADVVAGNLCAINLDSASCCNTHDTTCCVVYCGRVAVLEVVENLTRPLRSNKFHCESSIGTICVTDNTTQSGLCSLVCLVLCELEITADNACILGEVERDALVGVSNQRAHISVASVAIALNVGAVSHAVVLEYHIGLVDQSCDTSQVEELDVRCRDDVALVLVAHNCTICSTYDTTDITITRDVVDAIELTLEVVVQSRYIAVVADNRCCTISNRYDTSHMEIARVCIGCNLALAGTILNKTAIYSYNTTDITLRVVGSSDSWLCVLDGIDGAIELAVRDGSILDTLTNQTTDV